MDAINRLPVTTIDARQPRDRADAAPDQHESGFSFESLLDERNLASSHHPPMEAEEQGTGVLVELRKPLAVETGEEVVTLVAMLSTPPPAPVRTPDELAATELAEEVSSGGKQVATSIPAEIPQRRDSVPLADDTPTPDQPRREFLPTANPRGVAVVENMISLPITSTDGKLRGVIEPVERAIPKDAVAEVPSQDAASLTHDAALTPQSDALPHTEAPSPMSDVSISTPPVEAAPVSSAKEQVPLVAAPAIHEADKNPGDINPATPPLKSAATVLVSSASGLESSRVALTRRDPVSLTDPGVRETSVRSGDLAPADPLLGPGKVGRSTKPAVIGMVEAPLVGESPAVALPATPPIPPAEESFAHEVSLPEQRNLPVTRGSLPQTLDTVSANIPEGVTVEVIDPARTAAPASSNATTSATGRTFQGPAQPSQPVPLDGAPLESQSHAPRPDRAAVPQFGDAASIRFDGTSNATQERVMPDTLQPRSPEPKTLGPAANFNAANPSAPAIGARADGNSPFQHNSGSDARQEERSAFQQQPRDVMAAGPTFVNPVTLPAPTTTEPTAITRTDVETIFHRTEEAAERLRVTGNERVEVRVRLEAGQELTVRLRFSNGEVTPVFLTESQDLRQAIEQNWAQFSERSSERTTRLTTPVFESPNSQSGMNDLNQRQREGRERAFTQAQAEAFAAANAPGRVAPRRPNAAGPTLTEPVGLQLYA